MAALQSMEYKESHLLLDIGSETCFAVCRLGASLDWKKNGDDRDPELMKRPRENGAVEMMKSQSTMKATGRRESAMNECLIPIGRNLFRYQPKERMISNTFGHYDRILRW